MVGTRQGEWRRAGVSTACRAKAGFGADLRGHPVLESAHAPANDSLSRRVVLCRSRCRSHRAAGAGDRWRARFRPNSAMAQAASPQAIAEYRRLLREYQEARAAFDEEAGAYWSSITEKRRGRNAKRRDHQPIALDDYVLTQPPVYTGPKRPVDPEPEEPDARPPRQHKAIPCGGRSVAGRERAFSSGRRKGLRARSSSSAPMRAYARPPASRASRRCGSIRSRPAAPAITMCRRASSTAASAPFRPRWAIISCSPPTASN